MGAAIKHALVAFGANLPFNGLSAAESLCKSQDDLASCGLIPVRVSRLFETPCFPAGAGPDYVNAVGIVAVPGKLTAAEVLDLLHQVEERFGRTRATRWGMRTLDLDLLALEDQVLPDPLVQSAWRDLAPDEQVLRAPETLILPHPRLQDRAFVLVPLADVAPDWVHPATGQTVAAMLAALPPEDRAAVVPIVRQSGTGRSGQA
jgi:2-amino-4-hydroxy-6-hydroxymethyldihydropteridine diphosphokinase